MKNEILKLFEKMLEGYSNKKAIYRQACRIELSRLTKEAQETAFQMVEEGLLQYHGYNETFKPYFQLKKKGFEELFK